MKRYSCIGLVWLSLAASTAAAQTGVALLLRPWSAQDRLQLHSDVSVLNRGNTDNRGASISIESYEVSGRWRPVQEQSTSNLLAVGFDTQYLNLSTSDPALPDRLVDQSVAVGLRVSEDGKLQLVLGLGYAGNTPYGDADAFYGQASLIYTKPIDAQSQWTLVLGYDSHRVLLPDTPLPAVLYQRQVSAAFRYGIGFPVNRFDWQVNDQLAVRVAYILPVTINVAVEYELDRGWKVFGRFDNQTGAFKVDGGRDHRRLFFRHRRIEAGIRLESDQRVDLTLAVGYAFDGQFSTGFDVRDLEDIADVTDEPYFRVAVSVPF